MPPMMANPKAHDWAIFLNSTVNQQIPATSGFSQTSKNLYDSLPNFFTASTALSIYLFILYYLSIEIFIYLDYVEFNFLNINCLLFWKYITSFML